MRKLFGLIALLVAYSHAAIAEQKDNPVVHGTINIVLANKNGMVVLTDSMLTAGNQQLQTPGKKLFKLDDRSVCAVAGIIFSPSGSYKELDMSTVAIVDDYARQIGTGPPLSIVQKLRELAFALNISLSAVENVRTANNQPVNPHDYILQLTVAGYDTDGLLKIGKVTIASQSLAGGTFDSLIQSGAVHSVSDSLVNEFSGMPDRAEFIMGHPETVSDDAPIVAYNASLKADGGKSLTLEQMIGLAKRLKHYSQIAHPEVGGPDQFAILRAGKIETFSQPPFPDSGRARKFSIVVASSFTRSGVTFSDNTIFVRCSWNSMLVPMDGRFFAANEFRNSLLSYGGGQLHLDASNRFIDSAIVLQYSKDLTDLQGRVTAGQSSNFDAKRLLSSFVR